MPRPGWNEGVNGAVAKLRNCIFGGHLSCPCLTLAVWLCTPLHQTDAVLSEVLHGLDDNIAYVHFGKLAEEVLIEWGKTKRFAQGAV